MYSRGDPNSCQDPNARFVWQIWPSRKNIILLRGICITGNQPIIFVIACFCACVPFYSFITSRTAEDPVTSSYIILCIWFAVVLALMLRISCMDPGIIPRRSVAERIYSSRSWDIDTYERLVDPFKDVPGAIFCHTCEVMRPPTASHCSDCDNCVLGFDHHCAVLNNCIGQRNYIYFFSLLPSICFLVVAFLFRLKLPSSNNENKSENNSLLYSTLTFISMSIAVSAALLVFGLLAYHSWLLFVAKTTTKRHLRGLNPLSSSWFDRLRGVDTLFDLRQEIQSDISNISCITSP
jgi:palmitoyltransferase ZDHHC9/14/18